MVAREVLPDRGSRNLKHHERAPFDVIRNESPVALKSATSSLPAVGGAIFRISVSVSALRMTPALASVVRFRPWHHIMIQQRPKTSINN
jgi:hypothetical protein